MTSLALRRCFFLSSRRRHTRWNCDWSSDVCSSDLDAARGAIGHTRDQMILGGDQQARLGFTEAHEGARVRARHEPAAVYRNVSAGNSRDPVIGHDSQAAGKRFGLPRGKRFPDIKDTKKYKAQLQIFPVG